MEKAISIIGAVAAVIAIILAWPGFRLSLRQLHVEREHEMAFSVRRTLVAILFVVPPLVACFYNIKHYESKELIETIGWIALFVGFIAGLLAITLLIKNLKSPKN